MVKRLVKYMYAILLILLIKMILIKVLLIDGTENDMASTEMDREKKLGHIEESRRMESFRHGNKSKYPNFVYKERRKQMLKACASLRTRASSSSYVKSNIIIDRRRKIAFCPVEKVASTFWRRVMRIVVGLSSATSPFDNSIKAFDAFYTLRTLDESMIDRFMNPSLTFMFVRDPYSRLFSAYVDKLVSPNCDYWRGIGALGIQLFRTNNNDMDKKCGHDMTFREFVKTVIYSEEHLPFSERNVHFTPIFQHCDPCRYRWYVIGKMETFESDVFHLLDRMARTDIKRSLEETFHAQYLHYTIRDQCNWLYHFRKRYRSDCNMTFHEAQKRLWRHFKIRGILRRQIPFPISPGDSGRISKNKLIQIVYNAMGNTNDRLDAMRNRKQAFLEAYSKIDMDDLIKLSKIFHADCELFGYDCKPGEIFNRKGGQRQRLFFA